ncbi:hypothetical protein, partial [Human papillomavirus 121]
NIKTKLFLPLLPLAPLPLPGNLLRGTPAIPPGTPKLSRRYDESRRGPRIPLCPPVRKHLDFDITEDDEKENQELPGAQREEEPTSQTPPDLLTQLLHKWGVAIDQLADIILQDLKDCKQKLGIPQ